jgi:hypothetical protein
MKSLLSFAKITPLALSALLLGACSDDSSDGDTAGSAGTAGGAGSAGSAGTGGGAGSAGTGGGAGSAGTGGGAGSAGTGGGAGSSGMGATAMSFFVTSAGSGADGGNLGGLTGADERCQDFAAAVGAGSKTWRAYLSTSTVNARDRIGSGPWFNQAGVQIAATVAALHTDGLSNGNPQHILDETGTPAPANQHDILTGSLEDGTIAGTLTCADWTSNAATPTGQPQVGHSDIPGNPDFSPSWNSAHVSGNCSQAGLVSTGGAGRLYCFAIN